GSGEFQRCLEEGGIEFYRALQRIELLPVSSFRGIKEDAREIRLQRSASLPPSTQLVQEADRFRERTCGLGKFPELWSKFRRVDGWVRIQQGVSGGSIPGGRVVMPDGLPRQEPLVVRERER